MIPDELQELLNKRDALVAGEDTVARIELDEAIENEAIRELGRIVIEVTSDENVVFSTT